MATKFQDNQSINDGLDHQNGDRPDIDGDDQFRYLIIRPEKAGLWDLVMYALFGDTESGVRFLEVSDEQVLGETRSQRRSQKSSGSSDEHTWVMVFSTIALNILSLIWKPLEWTGYVVDFILNLLSLNGNLSGLLSNVVRAGTVMVPKRGTENFLSTIGQLDGRINLYESCERLAGEIVAVERSRIQRRIKAELGNRALMDLCIMASKLSYENANVVRKIVTDHWKMHFVDFYDCWNDFQNEMSTQVFILCDKPKDANFILVTFRGTEPFDADGWSTDFDYSWHQIPRLGKVHTGFLEALGFGNRTEPGTFRRRLMDDQHQKIHKLNRQNGVEGNMRPSEGIEALPMVENSAYYVVREKLESLLGEHKNAKFVVTGHSVGGALAILFPTVLVFHKELELMKRLMGVYTFGQPRIGNCEIAERYMEAQQNNPVENYFRVVYSNDIVARLPYDDRFFGFKHFGVCLYYDSLYYEQVLSEAPNKNFFAPKSLIPRYLTAAWELLRSFTMGYTHGPEYKEGWFSILLRTVGLVLPGFSAHSPTNYVNSVRLGKKLDPPK